MAEQLNNIDDAEQLLQAVAMVQEQGKLVEALAKQFEDDMAAYEDEVKAELTEEQLEQLGPTPRVEVVLTPQQRARVQEETGVDMTSVKIPDPGGMMTRGMRQASPPEIEAHALKQAEEFNVMVAAHQQRMAEIQKIRVEIHATEDEELIAKAEALIAEMLAEPPKT